MPSSKLYWIKTNTLKLMYLKNVDVNNGKCKLLTFTTLYKTDLFTIPER